MDEFTSKLVFSICKTKMKNWAGEHGYTCRDEDLCKKDCTYFYIFNIDYPAIDCRISLCREKYWTSKNRQWYVSVNFGGCDHYSYKLTKRNISGFIKNMEARLKEAMERFR